MRQKITIALAILLSAVVLYLSFRPTEDFTCDPSGPLRMLCASG